MDKVERLTYANYIIGMEAYSIKQMRKQESLAMQAWFNQNVKATTGSSKNPKPKFKKFKDFFDLTAEIDSVRASFEEGYRPSKITKRDQSKIFTERYKEFIEMKKHRKEVEHG
jgi:hypothetical protein